MRPGWILAVSILCGLAVSACGGGRQLTRTAGESLTPSEASGGFALNSPAFSPGEPIPARYTCDGIDVSPALSWGEAPDGTQAFALTMDDPDAPSDTFTHWVLFNLPDGIGQPSEGVPTKGRLENGALQGRNDFDRVGYRGPCPPSGGPHRYRFHLYALGRSLDLGAGVRKGDVLSRIEGHVLADDQLVGTYQR